MTNTPKTNKSAMAEVLVRHVLGESESFELACDRLCVSMAEGVEQALKNWMSGTLTLVTKPARKSEPPPLMLPDPSDCPQGQEAEWLALCDHDLNVLRREQQRCIQAKDAAGLNSANMSIEAYLQAVAGLRERVA